MSALPAEWPCKRWQSMFPQGVQAIGPKVQVFDECLVMRLNACSFWVPPEEIKVLMHAMEGMRRRGGEAGGGGRKGGKGGKYT